MVVLTAPKFIHMRSKSIPGVRSLLRKNTKSASYCISNNKFCEYSTKKWTDYKVYLKSTYLNSLTHSLTLAHKQPLFEQFMLYQTSTIWTTQMNKYSGVHYFCVNFYKIRRVYKHRAIIKASLIIFWITMGSIVNK